MIAIIVNLSSLSEEYCREIRNGPPIQEQSLIWAPKLNLLLIAAELNLGTFQKDAQLKPALRSLLLSLSCSEESKK